MVAGRGRVRDAGRRPPFSSAYQGGLLFDILYGEIDLAPLADAPQARAVVERCLQRDPAQRYATADAVARDLRHAQGSPTGLPNALRPRAPSAGPASRTPDDLEDSAPAGALEGEGLAADLEDDPPSVPDAPLVALEAESSPPKTAAGRRVPALALAGALAAVLLAVAFWPRAEPPAADLEVGTGPSGAVDTPQEQGTDPPETAALSPALASAAPSRTTQPEPLPPSAASPAPLPSRPTTSRAAPVTSRPSPPPAAPPPATGTVVVDVVPSGSARVAGQQGASGSSFALPVGRHAVTCQGPGATHQVAVTVAAGGTQRVACHFQADVRVRVAFPDDVSPGNRYAYVVVDGRRTQTTAPGRLTLPVGTHQVGLVRDGFTTAQAVQTVTVRPSDRPVDLEVAFHLRSD